MADGVKANRCLIDSIDNQMIVSLGLASIRLCFFGVGPRKFFSRTVIYDVD